MPRHTDSKPRTDPDERSGRGSPHSPGVTPARKPASSAGRAQSQLKEFLDSFFVLAAVLSPDGTMLEANERALTAFGLDREDIVGASFLKIAESVSPPRSVEGLAQLLKRAAAGETATGEFEARLAGGQTVILDCSFTPTRDSAGRIMRITATGIDVTAHKRAEIALEKLNRELRLLSGCNRMLVRTQDEKSLFDNICGLIVKEGGYCLAWVGIAQHDAHKSVRPVAVAGQNSDYVLRSRITWAESERGLGPTGRAIRRGSIEICRDITSDPLFASWRDDAGLQSYASSIALPLIGDRGCIGALNIYSQEANSFDETEIKLLSELARDLSFGLEALRARRERTHAMEQTALFRELLQQTNDMVYVADARTGRILDVNDSGARRLGYTREQMLKMRVPDFSVLTAEGGWAERADNIRSRGRLVMEGEYRTRSGETFPVEFSLRYIERRGKEYIIEVTRDIVERRRQRAQIERLARILRMQSGISSAVLHIRDRDELLQEACRLATEVGGYDRAVFSLVDPGGRFAVPTFRAGAGIDFPEPERLEIPEDAGRDRNLSGRALRTGHIAVNNDLARPDPPVAMREELVRLGYKGMAALPLTVEGRRVGVLTLTTRDEILVADEELLILLQEMMSSLSFALRSKEHADAAQYLAYYDSLTGLAKRSLFLERLEAFLRNDSSFNREIAVIAFDVRGLNRINDTFGRHFGDQVLQMIAERLKAYARSDTHIGYFGGGAFALLEPPLSAGDESIRSVLDASLFAEPFEIEGQSLRLSCSYGVAHSSREGTDGDALLQRAEAALKQAKESGEHYLHYRLEMHGQIAERLQLEHKLSAAIAENQFELYYQPQKDLKSGRIESLEALLRWNDPDAGVVTPPGFLPVLESTGMILTVGDWALDRAVSDCERWFKLGMGPLRVAVNVSAVQLRQRGFVQKVLDCCTRLSGCQGFGLDLEITESTLLQDLDGTIRKLRELRSAGVRIALDDFGTGYSSLGLLSRLPVDLLKIDRSFVRGLPGDASSVMLVETVLRLASAFKLTTVAEGVETAEQLQALQTMRCDIWQGYLHCPPLPAQQIELRLNSG